MKTIFYYLKRNSLLFMLLLPIEVKASVSSIQDPSISNISDIGEIELVSNQVENKNNHITIDGIADTKDHVTTNKNNTAIDYNALYNAIYYQNETNCCRKWCRKLLKCIFFWRVFEYKGIYIHPGYEAGLIKGSTYCLRDTAGVVRNSCRKDKKRLRYIPKTQEFRVRWNARLHGHPICTRTILFSGTLIFYALLNMFVKSSSNKLDMILGSEFQLCTNDLLDKTVPDFSTYDTSNFNANEGLSSLLGFIDSINWSNFPNIPSVSAMNQLEEELAAYSLIVNATHNKGYDFYDPFWPNEATRESVQTFYEVNNFSSSTTTIQSSTTSDVTVNYFDIERTLCFSVGFRDITTIEYGIGGTEGTCRTFTIPGGANTTNNSITRIDITTFNSIQNNYYKTTVTNDISFIQLDNFDLNIDIDFNVSADKFVNIAQEVSRAGKEKLRREALRFFNRVHIAAGMFPFVIALTPFITTGYEVNKLGMKLRFLTTLGTISRLPFIIIIIGLIYLFEFLPFRFVDIFILLRTPHLIIDFILDIGTGICHLRFEELAFIYGLGQIEAQQQKLVDQMRNLVNFVNHDIAVEQSYLNITGLTFQDLYQNLTVQHTNYEKALNGSILQNGFAVLPGKVLCDFNQTGTIFNITDGVNCATFADIGYASSALNQLRDDYVLSLKGINWLIILYPFMPTAFTMFIEAIFRFLFPMAKYSGKFISNSAIADPENQQNVMTFIRYTAIIPLLWTIPLIIIGFANNLIF